MASARLPAYFGIKRPSRFIQFTSTLTYVDTVDTVHPNDDAYITVPGENEIQATCFAAGLGVIQFPDDKIVVLTWRHRHLKKQRPNVQCNIEKCVQSLCCT